MERKDLAIMYHYVCPPEQWTGSVPISPERFEEQVIYLKTHYDIVTPEELSLSTSRPKAVLTFDDGTRDQYQYAFPILKKHKVAAHFSIMSGPLKLRVVPIFHLVHTVLSHYTDSELWEELQVYQEELSKEEADTFYFYETSKLRRYVKYLLNFALNEKETRRFLEEKVECIYGSLDSFIEYFYIQPEEIQEMHQVGMSIGVHCVHHRPYQEPAEQFYKEEIEPCLNYLQDELQLNPTWYTPAFGGGPQAEKMQRQLQPYLETWSEGAFLTIPGSLKGEYWEKRVDGNHLKGEEVEYE